MLKFLGESLERTLKRTWVRVMLVVLYVVLAVWYPLKGMEISFMAELCKVNTEALSNVSNKTIIFSFLLDGTMQTPSGDYAYDLVTGFTRVLPNIGYYLNLDDMIMAVPLTMYELFSPLVSFLTLSAFIYLMSLGICTFSRKVAGLVEVVTILCITCEVWVVLSYLTLLRYMMPVHPVVYDSLCGAFIFLKAGSIFKLTRRGYGALY